MNLAFLENFFLALGNSFSVKAYMTVTTVQGILWGIADVLIIFSLLKIIKIVRKTNNKPLPVKREILLWISAVMIPFLVFPQTPKQFFFLESIIFGIQFVILLYSLFADLKDMMYFFRKIVSAVRPSI